MQSLTTHIETSYDSNTDDMIILKGIDATAKALTTALPLEPFFLSVQHCSNKLYTRLCEDKLV